MTLFSVEIVEGDDEERDDEERDDEERDDEERDEVTIGRVFGTFVVDEKSTMVRFPSRCSSRI